MRTMSAPADAYRLHSMVERMVREGMPEDAIVAAVEEADNRPTPPANRPARPSLLRLSRSHRSS